MQDDDSAPDPDESVRFGIVTSRRLRDELDETKRRREERRVESVSRSEVAREAMLIGLAAMDLIDEEPALRGCPTSSRCRSVSCSSTGTSWSGPSLSLVSLSVRLCLSGAYSPVDSFGFIVVSVFGSPS